MAGVIDMTTGVMSLAQTSTQQDGVASMDTLFNHLMVFHLYMLKILLWIVRIYIHTYTVVIVTLMCLPQRPMY